MTWDASDARRSTSAHKRETVHVALVGDQGSSAALDHFAHDLADALAAYEHLGFPGRERVFDLDLVSLRLDECAHDCEQSLAGLPEASRLYALAVTTGPTPQGPARALETLSKACEAHNVAWGGGVAIAGGELAALCATGPRMGRMRRAQSEAIDQLVLAIRTRSGLQELPDGPDTGIIAVPAPVPTCLYGLALKLHRLG